jgi:hypothetical protein
VNFSSFLPIAWGCINIRELNISGNPGCSQATAVLYLMGLKNMTHLTVGRSFKASRLQIIQLLPHLGFLDGISVSSKDRDDAFSHQSPDYINQIFTQSTSSTPPDISTMLASEPQIPELESALGQCEKRLREAHAEVFEILFLTLFSL